MREEIESLQCSGTPCGSQASPRALVLRAPGINCDRETAQACRLVGFATDLLHINTLLNTPNLLLDYDFLVIPGGFSYSDDLGAGTLLAKNLTIHLGQQLQQFIEQGRLILGICNGFQVLVRAGLLPGHLSIPGTNDGLPNTQPTVGADLSCPPPIHRPTGWDGATLTDNASAQFECRWVTLSPQPGPCIFTQGITHPIELPVAHGEGRFVLADPTLLSQLQTQGQIPLLYRDPDAQMKEINLDLVYEHDEAIVTPSNVILRCAQDLQHISNPRPSRQPQNMEIIQPEIPYPHNPNGSIGNIAGICNAQGNVFGLMPHPERYVHALQHPQRRVKNGYGDGLLIFKNAYEHARKCTGRSIIPTTDLSATTRRGRFIAPTADLSAPETPPYIKTAIKGTAISTSYTVSGVNIAAADHAKKLMQETVRATQGPEVLAGMGAFAGVFDASAIKGMRKPALVASTDGVGTKTLIAVQAGRFDTIGYDLVNHCVNDLLTQGARPLFFMDYLAMGKLDPMQAAAIVRGVATACQQIGCTLLGGETAEMPDVYLPTAFDLAGTIIGIVEQDSLLDNAAINVNDVLLGLPSSGLHTNGYSLARRVFTPYSLDTDFPELGEPLVDALLRPHRSYLREIQMLSGHPAISIKGIAHITGGGFEGNLARILPTGRQAVIQTNTWTVPPLFQLIARLGQVTHDEMYRAFNMGIGMILVVSPDVAEHAQRLLPELLTVGYITNGEGVVLSF